MPKYTVHLLSPMITWDDVEAKTKTGAIDKCHAKIDSRLDLSEGPFHYRVEEIEEEE